MLSPAVPPRAEAAWTVDRGGRGGAHAGGVAVFFSDLAISLAPSHLSLPAGKGFEEEQRPQEGALLRHRVSSYAPDVRGGAPGQSPPLRPRRESPAGGHSAGQLEGVARGDFGVASG